MKDSIVSYKVQITELGEVLEYQDLRHILDIIVDDYNYSRDTLLENVAITEVRYEDGSTGVLPISTQVALINSYISDTPTGIKYYNGLIGIRAHLLHTIEVECMGTTGYLRVDGRATDTLTFPSTGGIRMYGDFYKDAEALMDHIVESTNWNL